MTRTLLILLIALPVMAVLLFWGLQRRLIYFPLGTPGAPASAGLPQAEEVRFATDDGLVLQGWFVPAADGEALATVLVCNGNGGHRGLRADLAAGLAARGMSVLLFDYRGYGGNPGRPMENGLYRDARAARLYLDSRDDVDPHRVLYLGESLGAAVCLALAVERPPLGLVLRSPFTSLVEVAAHHYPFLPVRWMLRDRYPSIERAPRLTCPVEVIAGARDRIVPPEQSRRLAEVLDGRGRLTVVPGAGHNDPELAAGPTVLKAAAGLARAAPPPAALRPADPARGRRE